jgi:hypothetical protein
VINWTGPALLQPNKETNIVEEFIGDKRVVLPIGWESHFQKLSGRQIRAHGVSRSGTNPQPIHILSLNERFWVKNEMPAGLAKLDHAGFYFGLALVPIGVMIGIALKIRFHMEYLLVFGLVSAFFALYGINVNRRNRMIQQNIASIYQQRRSTDVIAPTGKR